MPVNAIKPYNFPAEDTEANFHGARLVYVGWNRHLMFATPYAWPLPPNMPFGALTQGPMAGAFAQHPDWEKIDWSVVAWTKNGEPFTPDYEASLAENGIVHKDSLRFTTPGLDGIGGLGQ